MPSKPVKPRAPRTIRVPIALPEESQSQSWLRSIRMSGFAGLVLVILVLFIVVLAPGLHKEVKDTYFRIGHMGVTVVNDKERGDLDHLLKSLKEVLADAGHGPAQK